MIHWIWALLIAMFAYVLGMLVTVVSLAKKMNGELLMPDKYVSLEHDDVHHGDIVILHVVDLEES